MNLVSTVKLDNSSAAVAFRILCFLHKRSYSEVYDSIHTENVDIGRYSHIRKAIIDNDVTIPPGTKTGYDLEEDRKRYHVMPSGIVVIAKGTVLPEENPTA